MSLHLFQERSQLSLFLKIYPLFHLIYPPKMTCRLPLMISYLQILSTPQQFVTKLVYMLLLVLRVPAVGG